MGCPAGAFGFIFLDIDGVLNSEDWKAASRVAPSPPGAHVTAQCEDLRQQLDPEAVRRLHRLVQATHAQLVLSSPWRDVCRLAEVRTAFALRGWSGSVPLVSRLPSLGLGQRGREIATWLGSLQSPPGFAVLDDNPEGLEALTRAGRVVRVDPRRGLQPEDATRAIEMLGRLPSAATLLVLSQLREGRA